MSWTEMIREAIRSDGRPVNAVAKAAGLDGANLRKFLDGKVGMTVDTLERIGPVVGLSLTPARGVLLPAKELPSQPEVAQPPTREPDSIPRAGGWVQPEGSAPHAGDEAQALPAPAAPITPTHQPSLTPRAGDRNPFRSFKVDPRAADKLRSGPR